MNILVVLSVIRVCALSCSSNKKVKFKKGTKYRYTMHLKSPRVCGVKVWDMLPAPVQKATTKVKFKVLINFDQLCNIRPY